MARSEGCCGLSLKACTVTLASLNLLYTLSEIAVSAMLEYVDTTRPHDAIGDEDYLDLSTEAHSHSNRSVRSGRSAYGEGEDYSDAAHPEVEELEEHVRRMDEFRFILIVVIIFSSISVILLFMNIISLSVLIYGAAKSKTRCIRQWLYIGGAVIACDVLSFLVYVSLGVHLIYAMWPLMDTPLAVYLWVMASRWWERCRDMDRRNAEAPVSMAALLEDGDTADNANSACTVTYSALD
ncbi:uncharacterized protein LOC117650656 [Thrips palmi]|uniref:Uncharacterized protein LOC117650656 n=1 Tax=Thrips palmi TaxID=161013 RepID=A0A6P8ZXH0_THRPL|nr:uncharacterized protein LOC117650656 [Thrips palmi]